MEYDTDESIVTDNTVEVDELLRYLRSSRVDVHVTDTSLCPSTGNLRCRLDPIIDHIPYEAGGRARCRLHWWDGVETQKTILACPGCGVSFCVKCYRLFYKEADIVEMKIKLMKEFKKGK